jgi:hypothetical protein
LPENLHNKMLAFSLQKTKDKFVEKYFKLIKEQK